MLASKRLTLSIKGIIGLFILVYGTAILFRLLLGKYLMVDGLMDINYLLLFLLCAVPIVLGILIDKEKASKMIVMSGVFFGTLYIPVYGVLIYSVLEMTPEILTRILTVIPLSALILVVVSYFIVSREK